MTRDRLYHDEVSCTFKRVGDIKGIPVVRVTVRGCGETVISDDLHENITLTDEQAEAVEKARVAWKRTRT